MLTTFYDVIYYTVEKKEKKSKDSFL
jgi:hypothetical protein